MGTTLINKNPHAPRSTKLDDIAQWMSDLLDAYQPDGENGPTERPLLQTLDQMAASVAQTATAQTDSKRPKPGPRPPASIAHIDHAQTIRKQAITWDRILRKTDHERPARIALAAIETLAETADETALYELHHDIRKWHRVARIIAGYHDPTQDTPHHYPNVACFVCGQTQIYGAPSTLHAQCRACGDEYPPTRLINLLRVTEAAA